MANAMETTLSTIELLESRLLRIEHLLYGPAATVVSRSPNSSAVDSMAELERRFSSLLSRFRVYTELLKIYRSHPSLFQPPPPHQPPSQLTPGALRATVLSCAASYPATASALTAATADTPVPDPALSAGLVALLPRMRALEAVQDSQDVEMAALRARSEVLVRKWLEGRVAGYSRFVADVEGRVERVEKGVRRVERRGREEEET